jgi:tetratricopeptide (TPR) repeat protein
MNTTCLSVGHDVIGSSLHHIATNLINQGKYDQALDYLVKSLKMREILFSDINDVSLINDFRNFSLVSIKQQKYDNLLEYLKGAFTLAENMTDIAIVYRETKDYNKAFEYFEKALKMKNKIMLNLI